VAETAEVAVVEDGDVSEDTALVVAGGGAVAVNGAELWVVAGAAVLGRDVAGDED